MPVSIVAVSGAALEKANVRSAGNLQKLVPSLNADTTLLGAGVSVRTGGFGASFIIRNSGGVRFRGVDFDGEIADPLGFRLNDAATGLGSIYSTNEDAPALEGCKGLPGSPMAGERVAELEQRPHRRRIHRQRADVGELHQRLSYLQHRRPGFSHPGLRNGEC